MKQEFLEFAVETSSEAGRMLTGFFRDGQPRARGTSKEVRSLLDRASDEIIKKAIEKNYPNHSYLTEETGLIDKGSDYLWIVDPLDGTGNFENHNPLFSVSIALFKKARPVLGVVEAPFLKERFIAVEGNGFWAYDFHSGEKEQKTVSRVNQLDKSYFVYCEGGEKNKERLASLYSKVFLAVKDVRKIGSAALELAWVASGRAEGYFTTKISLWDIAAGILFVKEAGGDLLRFNGEKIPFEEFAVGREIDFLATNGKIKIVLE